VRKLQLCLQWKQGGQPTLGQAARERDGRAPPRVPGLDRRSFSVRQNKMRASSVELSKRDGFLGPLLAFRSGIDGTSGDLLLHLLYLFQHFPDGRRDPVEHSICIIHKLACVVGQAGVCT
jgi:hypothetical protein